MSANTQCNAAPPERWRCDECDEVHDCEDDAVECCRPRVVQGYGCPTCGGFYLSTDEAFDCHLEANQDPDAPTRTNPYELEAAGQERLFA